MIRNISGSKYIQVSGSMSTNPYISPGASGIAVGMVRWSASMNCLEINDGNSWQQLHSAHPMIALTSDAETLLDWARAKRDEEWRIAELAAKHPTVADALGAVREAEQQLKTVVALCTVS